jgi:hypothetical protein
MSGAPQRRCAGLLFYWPVSFIDDFARGQICPKGSERRTSPAVEKRDAGAPQNEQLSRDILPLNKKPRGRQHIRHEALTHDFVGSFDRDPKLIDEARVAPECFFMAYSELLVWFGR